MNKENLILELEEALKNNNAETIINLSTQAVENFPEESFGYYFLGEGNLLNYKYPNAEICFGKAIELDDNVSYKLRFADNKNLQGLYEDAMIVYAQILKFDNKNFKALLGLGNYHLNDENFEAAIDYYSRALEIAPNNKDIYISRASANVRLNNFEAAMNDIAVAESDTFNEMLEIIKLEIYTNLPEKNSELLSTLKKLVEYLPDNLYYRLNYGKLLYSKNDFEAAENEFTIIIDSDKKEGKFNEATHNYLFNVKIKLNKKEDALPIIALLIENDPTASNYLFERAKVNYELKEFELALSDLNAASALTADDAKSGILELKSQIFLSLGKMAEAKTAFENLAKLDGFYIDGMIGMGLVLIAENKKEEAFNLLYPLKDESEDVITTIRLLLSLELINHAQKLELELADAFKENENSALKPFFGKLYKYDLQLNKIDNGLGEVLTNAVTEALKNSYVTLTERAIMLVFDIKFNGGFYKIISADANRVSIEIFETNAGSPPTNLTLNLNGNTLGIKTKENSKTFFYRELASELDSSFKNFVPELDFYVLGLKLKN
jgi:tetratricopeptide (TPR) repeat protein